MTDPVAASVPCSFRSFSFSSGKIWPLPGNFVERSLHQTCAGRLKVRRYIEECSREVAKPAKRRKFVGDFFLGFSTIKMDTRLESI
jgi:hypothetical protein